MGPAAQKVLDSPQPVVLLLGPARSGKTTAALEVYRALAGTGAQSRCIWLAPNAQAAEHIRRRLLAASPGGVICGPRVMTFAGLAADILARADQPARPMAAFDRRLLLRGIVSELAASGTLTALDGVADTPGLVTALDRAIAELKRGAIEPDALAPLAGASGRIRDLLEIYRRYQARMLESSLYDVEGQMWHARDCLAAMVADGASLVQDCDAVVLDGFTDFTPTQLRIVGLLSGMMRRVLITLPWEPGRPRLWHWATRAADAIRRELGPRLMEVALPPPAPASRLDQAAKALFDYDAPQMPPPDGLSLLVAAGDDAEIAAVARRIKALLVGGEPAGSIAVLARSLDASRPAIVRIFAEHGIPVAPAAVALTDVPVVRFLLQVASLPGGDFAFADVLAVIGSSYFQPATLGPYDRGTVAAAEMVIRQGNVLSGCASYAAAAERLASRMTVAACGDEADDAEGPLPQPAAHAITSAAAMLEALMGLAASAGTPPALLAMARTLQLHVVAAAHDEPELVARDLSALAALEAALSRLAAPYPPLADVVEALAAVACGGPRGEQVVDVLDVLDARAIRWRHVFAIGLTDRGFPRPQPAGALLTEGERLAWSRRGLAVDCTADLAAREMLLFYLAATRADVSLTLSLAGSDASGKSLAISPFVLDLLRPLGGIEAMQARGAVQHVPAGEFLRPPGQMASSREAVLALATLLGATEGPPAWKPAAVALAQSPLVARWLCRGSWARRRRWSAGPCDEFDGRLSHPSLLASLNDHTSGHIFSASQFNTFLRCPWAYFGRYVLGLEPLDEPTRRLEPIARGIFVHDVLRRIMEKLRGSAPDVALWSVPAVDVAAAMDAAIHAAAATVHAPYPALWEVQLAEIRRQIETYLNWQREAWAALKARSRHFELAFGVESTDGCDPRSTTQPVELTTAAGPIRVQGRIDRIDHVCLDELAGLMVVDYKTGALPSAKDISAAMDVQIGLYALAAEKLLAPALGGALHRVADRPGERLYGDIARQRGGGYSPATSDPPPREKLLTRLAEVVSAIRAGRFDLMPQRCISHCPLRQICHYSQARADRKQSLDGQPSAPLAPGKEAGDE